MTATNTDVTWCEAAATAGHTTAQYRLGLAYSTGKGVPTDYVQAHMWLNLAAREGDTEARRLREEIAADMSRNEIALAQRQAREWLGSRH